MERVLPVVLTGGRSTRFGRDKLREPVGAGLLVERPVAALRAVFGGPVALAGACDPVVAACGDLVIEDGAPGLGPMGGIIAALEHPLGVDGVFVLAGDLVGITQDEVRAVWLSARGASGAWAVLGDSGRVEPCVGVYRPAALEALRGQAARGRRSLHDALPAERVTIVTLRASALRNVNEGRDL